MADKKKKSSKQNKTFKNPKKISKQNTPIELLLEFKINNE